jgi:Zn-dependent protease
VHDSMKLGHVRGVRVGVNWSIFLLVGILAYALATTNLPSAAAGYPRWAYWLAGLSAAFGLFGGILVHELAHAIVARRAKMRVQGITLWFMGGLTRIEGDEHPGNELLVALVGPLISAIVGGAVIGLALLAQAAGSPLLAATLSWLGAINIVLGVFNLLPAAPLDGGKVLHGLVWQVTGNRWLATKFTAGAGTLLGALAVGAGFVTMEMGDLFNGIVLAVLGWFVLSSARGEHLAGRARYVLGDVRVSDIMRPAVIAPGWLTVSTFWQEWASHYPGAAFLLERWAGDGWAGVVTAQQLGAVPPGLQASLRAQDIALPVTMPAAGHDKGALRPDDPALAIAGRPGAALPVMDNGRVVGVVLATDVAAMVARGTPVQRRTWGPTVWPAPAPSHFRL